MYNVILETVKVVIRELCREIVYVLGFYVPPTAKVIRRRVVVRYPVRVFFYQVIYANRPAQLQKKVRRLKFRI